MTAFKPFPKIARLSRDVVITEKLDGTNAQVEIMSRAALTDSDLINLNLNQHVAAINNFVVWAGSRTRYVTPTADNYGFAAWVQEHAAELVEALGEGQHFGEWWGRGIQRNYSQTERHFSLFNTHRWGTHSYYQGRVGPCRVVPTLYTGPFDTNAIRGVMAQLQKHGSVAAPGFMSPEGIIIYHRAADQLFKKTIEKDEEPKGKLEGLGKALSRILPDAYPGATEMTMGGR